MKYNVLPKLEGKEDERAAPSPQTSHAPLYGGAVEVDEVIEHFGDAVDSGIGTLLVGAGLSKGAGHPGWSDLLRPFLDEFGVDPEHANLPEVAQWVVNRDHGDRSRLIGHVVSELNSVQAVPTTDHFLLAELPVDEIWTTNYDQLIEGVTEGWVTVELDEGYLHHAVGSRRIHKMHGSIHKGASEPVGGTDALVVTSHDYDLYEQRRPRTWRLLQAHFLTRSFLFLGFSLTDPNFEAVFRLVRVATPESHMSHFALVKRDKDDVPAFEARLEDLERSGVYVATYEEHSDITEFLTRLVARTRPSRLFVSGSHPIDGEPGVGAETSDYPAPAKTDELISKVAALMGSKLAAYSVRLAAGGVLGAEVGYAMIKALGGEYDPDALWILRRTNEDSLRTPPSTRQGTIVFIGSDPSELRDEVFDSVRALLVLHGGDGTRNEIARAVEMKMGIVPIGMTGGTAEEHWNEMRADIESFSLGGRPIPADVFEGLGSEDLEVATNSAVALVRQAMFAPVDGQQSGT